MGVKEWLAGRNFKGKLLLAFLATLSTGITEAVMIGLLFLGGVRSAEQRINPLLVQVVPEIPANAEKILSWHAGYVAGGYILRLSRDGKVSGEPQRRHSGVQDVRYQVFGRVPLRHGRWLIKPLDFRGWIRILEPPGEEGCKALRLLVDDFYSGGSPCAFEVYFASS